MLSVAASLVGGVGAYLAALPFVESLFPSAKARAGAEPIEVDLSALRPGELKPYTYRGRTILILRRTTEMIGTLDEMDERVLQSDAEPDPDPEYAANRGRSIESEFLIVEGICTHLGCVPIMKDAAQGQLAIGDWWRGGFICPCHTSGYDYAGRVVKGPAPSNLPIPPHRYLSPTRIVIGEEDALS